MLRELCRPFSYLSVRHPSGSVAFVNWWLPLAISGAGAMLWWYFRGSVDTFSSSGFFTKVLGFVQSLPGFYLAALAAVATFQKSDMDLLMPGVPPKANILYNGSMVEVALTRRRMLCIMFAFLTVESFGLTLGAITITTFASAVKGWLPEMMHEWVRLGGVFSYLVFLCQMLTVTLWGLFYLGERMHTPDN